MYESVDIPVIAEEGVQLPSYQTAGSSGADLYAHLGEGESISIAPGKVELIPTGLRIAIPQGFEVQVRPRSGLALKHRLFVLNTPATIDADYRGELRIILANWGDEDFIVTPGMRIAQMVVAPVCRAEFCPVPALDTTQRGEGGFGHTGMHSS